MKRFLHSLALAALGIALATSCHRLTHNAETGSPAGNPQGLAVSSAPGNGEGYLGMIARNYQVVPGHECFDGTTRKLAYAASLYRDDTGKLRLSGDACSNTSVEINPTEVTPVNPAGSVVSVRGGIFEYRDQAPVPKVNDIYNQFACTLKIDGVIYSLSVRADMAGSTYLADIHKKWYEPGATVRSAAFIERNIAVTSELVGTHRIFRGVSSDLLFDADLAIVGYRGMVLTTVHYSGTDPIDTTEGQCFVNQDVPRTH